MGRGCLFAIGSPLSELSPPLGMCGVRLRASERVKSREAGRGAESERVDACETVCGFVITIHENVESGTRSRIYYAIPAYAIVRYYTYTHDRDRAVRRQ